MFPTSQLKPYVEPEPDGEDELTITPEYGMPDTSMPSEEEMSIAQDDIVEEGEEPVVESTGAVAIVEDHNDPVENALKSKMQEDEEIEQETHKSVFSFNNNCVQTNRQPQNNMMNGFGMNPMMGMSMNPMMGGMSMGMNPMMGMGMMPGMMGGMNMMPGMTGSMGMPGMNNGNVGAGCIW